MEGTIIRNLSQEWVFRSVEELLQKNTDPFWADTEHRNDLACYVLNRIQSVYINSARGFLHNELTFKKKLQKQVDLLTLVSEGMKTIPNRRKEKMTLRKSELTESSPQTDEGNGDMQAWEKVPWNKNFYFHFPSILGKINLPDSSNEIEEIEVTLMMQYKNQLIQTPMISESWGNPCYASIETQYYYTFYPDSIPTKKGTSAREIFYFILHVAYKDKDNDEPTIQEIPLQIELAAVPTFGVNQKTFLHEVPDIQLQ